jgi:hypothetical protein
MQRTSSGDTDERNAMLMMYPVKRMVGEATEPQQ